MRRAWPAVATVMTATLMIALVACGGSGTTTPSPSSSGGVPDHGDVVILPSGSPTPLPTPTVAGRIVFAKVVKGGRSGNSDIYGVNTDGTGLERLSESPGWEDHPTWSPDGSKIVYNVCARGSDSGEDATLWVMNADGSGKRRLTGRAVAAAWASWSPDGKQIAFCKLTRSQTKWHIAVANADGSGVRQVTHSAVSDEFYPGWMPDGRIVFVRVDAYGSDLFMVDPVADGRERLTTGGEGGSFEVSPDGETIALDHGGVVCTIPTRGEGSPTVLLDPVWDYVPDTPDVALSWAPDGKALAVASSDVAGEYGSRLYIVNADGSGLSAVPGITDAQDPVWQPE